MKKKMTDEERIKAMTDDLDNMKPTQEEKAAVGEDDVEGSLVHKKEKKRPKLFGHGIHIMISMGKGNK